MVIDNSYGNSFWGAFRNYDSVLLNVIERSSRAFIFFVFSLHLPLTSVGDKSLVPYGSGIQWSAAGRSRSEVRGTEISEHARESRTGGGVALVGDPSENMVPKSTDEAQEAAEEAKHKRQQ